MGQSNTSGLSASANQLSGEQSQLINLMLSMMNGTQGTATGLQGLFGPLMGIAKSMESGAGAETPGLMQQLMQLATNPQALAALTGINAQGLVQGATNYMSNPGGTNLSKLFPQAMAGLGAGSQAMNLAGPQAMNFFRGEMQNGLNPMVANNAQSQLNQQFQSATDTAMANAGPGQNTQAITQDLTNSFLQNSTNLAGNLANTSQQYMNQGAAGLTGTAQAQDFENFQRIGQQTSLAGGLDAQKMQMLMEAAGLGTNYNQQVLGNFGQGVGVGQSALNFGQGLGEIGNQLSEFNTGTLGGLQSTLGNEAFNYTDLATQLQASQPNPWTMISQLVGGGVGDYATIMGLPGKSGGGGGGGGSNPA